MKQPILQYIYDRVSELVNSIEPARRSSVGFHLYDSFARVANGLNRQQGRPLHQLWIAAEEFRFMFDAHAVWLLGPNPQDDEAEEGIWEIGTLNEDEKLVLAPLLKESHKLPKSRRQVKGIRWDKLDQPLGRSGILSPKNSNLLSVDGVLVIDVPGEAGTAWRLAVFMEHQTEGRETHRGSSEIVETILPGDQKIAPALFLKALRHVRPPFGKLHSEPEMPPAFLHWSPARKQFAADNEHNTPKTFRESYQSSFSPLLGILDQMYAQMERIPGTEQSEGASRTLIFSCRNPNEESISFFPTTRQLNGFVKRSADIEPFTSFWSFRYPRGKAISGWVLATGASDYTEDFDKDPRWTAWIDAADEKEKPPITQQLKLVRKFFRVRNSDQKHAYVFPVVSVAQPHSNTLEPALMASVTSSAPLSLHQRRELFDIGVRLGPAFEMAMAAQLNYESSLRQELETQQTAKLAAGVGHDVRQFLQSLTTTLDGMKTEVESDNGMEERMQQFFLKEIEEAKGDASDIEDVCQRIVTYASKRTKLLGELVDIDLSKLIAKEIKSKGSVLKTCEPERSKRVVFITDFATDLPTMRADEVAIKQVVRNLLTNSLQATLPETLAKIHVETRKASTHMVELSVGDNGPGIDDETIARIDRGEFVSTKPNGVGLGLRLAKLISEEHGGRLEIRRTLNGGARISVFFRLQPKR